MRRRLKITGEREIIRQNGRVVRTHIVLLHKTRPFRSWQLGQPGARLLDQCFRLHRHQIRIGEIAIIVGKFLRPHQKRLARGVIPAARLLC